MRKIRQSFIVSRTRKKITNLYNIIFNKTNPEHSHSTHFIRIGIIEVFNFVHITIQIISFHFYFILQEVGLHGLHTSPLTCKQNPKAPLTHVSSSLWVLAQIIQISIPKIFLTFSFKNPWLGEFLYKNSQTCVPHNIPLGKQLNQRLVIIIFLHFKMAHQLRILFSLHFFF